MQQEIRDIVVLVQSSVNGTAQTSGNPYIKINILARSDDIVQGSSRTTFQGFKWKATGEDFEKLQKGKWILINRATYNTENEQLVIWQYDLTTEPQNLTDYITVPYRDIQELQTEMGIIIDRIQEEKLKNFIRAFWEKYKEEFIKTPAALYYHHAYIGGLLEHTLQVAKIAYNSAISLQKDGIKVNLDIIIAGAILHDIGKIQEYSWSPTYEIQVNPKTRLIGNHCLIGKDILEEFYQLYASQYDSAIPLETLEYLLHIILSHHGQLEWNACVEPATVEALLIHLADMVSAKSSALYKQLKEKGIDGYYRLYERNIRIWAEEEQEPKFPIIDF